MTRFINKRRRKAGSFTTSGALTHGIKSTEVTVSSNDNLEAGSALTFSGDDKVVKFGTGGKKTFAGIIYADRCLPVDTYPLNKAGIYNLTVYTPKSGENFIIKLKTGETGIVGKNVLLEENGDFIIESETMKANNVDIGLICIRIYDDNLIEVHKQ